MKRTTKIPRGEQKLYRLLAELDITLQELGIRNDWGSSAGPEFIADTLIATLCHIAEREDASKNLLISTARHLIDSAVRRERREAASKSDPTSRELLAHSLAELARADEANEATFAAILGEYRKGFAVPTPIPPSHGLQRM